MNTPFKLAIAAVAVVVVTLVGINLLPRSGSVGGAGTSSSSTSTQSQTAPPSPTAGPSQTASYSASILPTGFAEGPMQAGTYTASPLAPPWARLCSDPPQPGCTETHEGDSLRFTVTVPDGWSGIDTAIWLTGSENSSPDGAALGFGRGAWLLIDPCVESSTNWIPVGPTVADFVDAIAAHPILDTTPPVDVTLAGYSGKYFDLQAPADVSTEDNYNPACPYYRPWEPGIYAQDPSHRWHLWVLDVNGVRVVVQGMDYPGTSAQHQAELQAMVDSIQIQP